jgi:hypothetical protein
MKGAEVYKVLGDHNCKHSSGQMTFTEALNLSMQGNCSTAGQLFTEGVNTDPTCEVFLNRCQNFIQNHHPPEWKGL